MKLYIALVVRQWTSISTDTKMVEIVDSAMGTGFCPVFTTKEDAINFGYSEDRILEVEVIAEED